MNVYSLPAFALLPVYLFLGALILSFAQWIVQRQKLQGRAAEKAALLAELAHLRREAVRYNAPATFAMCAKFQRMANAKEKQLAALTDAAATPTWHDRVATATKATQVASAAAVTIALWKQPVGHVPPELSWPMSSTLSVPHGRDMASMGWVAVLPYMLMCSRVSTAIVQVLLPAQPSGGKQQRAAAPAATQAQPSHLKAQ